MAKVLHEAMIQKKGHTYVILTLFSLKKRDILQPQPDMVSKKKKNQFGHNFLKSMHVLEPN